MVKKVKLQLKKSTYKNIFKKNHGQVKLYGECFEYLVGR